MIEIERCSGFNLNNLFDAPELYVFACSRFDGILFVCPELNFRRLYKSQQVKSR